MGHSTSESCLPEVFRLLSFWGFVACYFRMWRFLTWLLLASNASLGSAGWSSRGKGSNKGDQSWKSSGWSYNSGSGKGQYSWHGSNNSANEALALHLLERLGRSESSSERDRSRRDSRRCRSSSRSKSRKSGSRDHELRELRAYREHHEAIERARADKEAKQTEKKLRAEEFCRTGSTDSEGHSYPAAAPGGECSCCKQSPGRRHLC